jgi:two-component system chemotaxis response regulator CheY
MKKEQMHFLVVDDDASSRGTIAEYLRELGFDRVTTAENGAHAIEVLDQDPTINFIISDWDMPMIDGLSLVQRVRSDENMRNIPFLIVTSPDSLEVEKILLAAESTVNAYIIKPFRIKTLADKIDTVLNKSIHGPQKTIVLIDDDMDALATVGEYLESFGFKTIERFDRAKPGLAFIESNYKDIALIISDWEMPEMTGMELLSVCKSTPRLADIPFLIITSQGSIEQMKVVRAAKARVDEYLLKPFKGAELKERIDQALHRNRISKKTRELIRKADQYIDRGYHAAAQKVYENLIDVDPKCDEAFAGLADVLLKTNSLDAALPYYKQAILLNPHKDTYYLRLVKAYEQRKLYSKAVALLELALQHISFSADLHLKLGQLYMRKGQYEESRAQLDKALELRPDFKEATIEMRTLDDELLKEKLKKIG